MKTIGIGDTVYYARCFHPTGIYDLCELHVRTVYPESFVGIDKHTKQVFLLGYNQCDVTVFDNRDEALRIVKEAEKHKRIFTKDSEDSNEREETQTDPY